MALIIANQGDIPRAIALWEQSLAICEQISDVQGKAATLNNMALIIANQGDIPRAIALWEQSLVIYEQIGDIKGKAATLANMAYWAGKTGDIARQLDLYLQAAAALAQVRAYLDLVTVLCNLAVADEINSFIYLAQALWLSLRIQRPLPSTINLIRAVFNGVQQGDELEALLGATALFFCNQRGEGHPQLAELQELSIELISIAASNQGVETSEALQTWFIQQRLNEPEYFLTQLNHHLEGLVGDRWLFDITQVG